MSLPSLIESRRVILCVGAGGVGKTTTSAAIALLAAKQGHRVLCLTIDPARRLAQSLGLEQLRVDAQRVDQSLFEEARVNVSGTMTVMMLDTKRTFDQIVERYASSPEVRDRILSNKLYGYVSTALSGTREYMAMEKLYEVKDDSSYDTIVLDTPPTSHALDFLDAPDRLIDALDSSATQWLINAFQSTRKLSIDLLAKSAAIALRGVGRFTGQGFLEQVAEFLTDINDLFGGFTERARVVQSALHGPDVAYVLVTSPSAVAIREVLFFEERLRSSGVGGDVVVVNRIHRSPGVLPTVEQVALALDSAGLKLDDDGPQRILGVMRDEATQAAAEAIHLKTLESALAAPSDGMVRIDVPAFPHDVHDLRTLDAVAAYLMGVEGRRSVRV